MLIAACLKWVDLRPEVDPLTGQVDDDPRRAGCSEADRAALEWALRLGEAWAAPVRAVTAGPAAAETVLRDALAAGAAEAVRVDLPLTAASDTVAVHLAATLGEADVVVCGDYSLDRGSGSVPAFLAHHLGAAQALGLVDVQIGPPGEVGGTRRLDGGRRERVRVRGRAVLSVEGATARLRRAPLAAALAARTAPIAVRPTQRTVEDHVPHRTVPFRPRARALPAPEGATFERLVHLTGALVDRSPPKTVVLDPDAAADAIIEQLRAWGYLP